MGIPAREGGENGGAAVVSATLTPLSEHDSVMELKSDPFLRKWECRVMDPSPHRWRVCK